MQQVKWVEQQKILQRSKRDRISMEDEVLRDTGQTQQRDIEVVIRDPRFTDQWYLVKI